MITVDRHLIGTFLRSYFMLLASGIGLYIFADVLANLDEFTENPDLSFAGVLLKMVDYYGHNLPLYYSQLGGVLLSVAAAFTIAIMLQNNELTALVAAGVPLQRLAVPVLLSSVVLVAAWMANSELLIPSLAHKIARHPDDVSETRTVEVHCVRDDKNAILTAGELRAGQGWMKSVYIVEPDANGDPELLISADAARYDAARQTWILDRGARLMIGQVFSDDGLGATIKREMLHEYPFGLSPEQILLRQSSQWSDLMSIRQMNTLLQSRNLPNVAAIAKSRDTRFTQPLLAWIMMLLTIPFFLTREPGNVLAAGGKALLLAGGCFAFTFVAHSLSSDPSSTRVATALPVLLFGPTAVVLLANVKT